MHNEGVYALHALLSSNLKDDLRNIKGIGQKWHDSDDAAVPTINPPEDIVPQERMDTDLLGYAWDLLPYRERPLDLYRSHFWHAGFDHRRLSPFAAIYTALGCSLGCDFCMINIVNRTDNGETITAADSRRMRFWSPQWVGRELERLAAMGVRTLRISDEMFFLNRRFYDPILHQIVDRGWDFNLWAYSRVDTVRRDRLELFKRAGFDWLALGIEAGNPRVRREASKGSYRDTDIRGICGSIRDTGIHVIGNYIFGLPDDTMETMRETLDLMLELNTETVNAYPCQALPGSPLYQLSKANGWPLPDSFEGYGFLAYECQPLPTRHLSAAQVLGFRDEAWRSYFTSPAYLDLVERKFGVLQRRNVEEMAKIRLKRKILGD